MSKKEDGKSLQRYIQKLMFKILVVLLVGLACIVIFGSFFFGIAGFFSLFNVQYTSLFALIKFVLGFFIVGFIVEPISRLMILITVNKMNSGNKLATRIIINCFFSWFSIYTADVLVSGIDIPILTEILAVAVLYTAEIAFASKEKSIAG